MRHALHPEAEEELAQAVRYYSAIDPELGVRFYREIERLILEVCAEPRRFRRFDPPARRHFSHWFPYSVIYLDEPERVWIVAVMHLKRQPSYWKHRLS